MRGRRVFGGGIAACIIAASVSGAGGSATQSATAIVSVLMTPDDARVAAGQKQGIKAEALLGDGQKPQLGGGGGAFWSLAFQPSIAVGVCGTGATSFSSQSISVDNSGAFHENWSPGTPNTLKADGLFTQPTSAGSVTGALTCGNGAASGAFSAVWTGTRYEGTYNFNGVNGNVVLTGLTWTSSDPSIATVDRGMVTGVAPGDVTITATYGSECWLSPTEPGCTGTVSGTATIHVTPANNGGGGNGGGGGSGGGGGGPIFSAGADRTVQCTGNSSALVTLDGSIGFDPGSQVITYTWTGPFGTASGLTPAVSLPLGANPLTFTISNGVQSATDAVVITVEDTLPPTIASATATPSAIWPPNGKMVDVAVDVSASDLCSSSLNCRIVAIASNEGGSGDWDATGPLSARLRATRAAHGAGRVYTLTVQCTDGAGLSTTTQVTVTVPHDRGK